MRPIGLDSCPSGSLPPHSVVMEQAERVVEPVLTPLLPSESPQSLGSHQVPPNLPFHPLADKRKALARVTRRKVVHPAGLENLDWRVGQLYRVAPIPVGLPRDPFGVGDIG